MPQVAQVVWSLNMFTHELKYVETSVSSVASHHRFRTTDTPSSGSRGGTNGKRIASPKISSSKMFQEMLSLTFFCKCLKLPILDSIRFVMCTVCCFLRFSDCTRGLIRGWICWMGGVDEGGRIARRRRLALVNSVLFRVMNHWSPHVLHLLATHVHSQS